MRLSVLLLMFTLITTTHLPSMEPLAQNTRPNLFGLPEEVEHILIFDIVAYCQAKGTLRQTCKYLNDFISQKKEDLLKHKSLRLTNEALTKFAFYYGHLGDTEIVLNLLEKGFDPNTEKSEGNRRTLLHYAAQYGFVGIANALLNHPKLHKGAVIKEERFGGIECPLSIAIEYDQDIIVKNILAACRSAGAIDAQAVRNKALVNDALQTIKILLAENIIKADKIDDNELALIEFTTMLDDFTDIVMKNEIVTIETGIFNDEDLEKIIFYFGRVGNTHVISKLLSQGIKIINPEDDTISTYPVNGENMLCLAAHCGLLNVVSTLLACNVSPNSIGNDGMPALHNAVIAADDAHLPIMKLLVSKGALVNNPIKQYNEKSLIGVAPLHFVAIFGRTDAAQFLIEHGANVNAKTDEDVTPLHAAAEACSIPIMQMLIHNGADVNAQDKGQDTPLHYMPDNKDAVSTLLACPNIDVNKRNMEGDTPLHAAMGNRCKRIAIEALLTHPNIMVNAKNNDKKTPLDLVNNQQKKLKDLLICHGAKTYDQLEGKAKRKKKDKCVIQ